MPIINPENLKQKNICRVQANAIAGEVRSLLAQGYSRRALYEELHGKGAFSGSYRRFCEYFRQAAPLAEPGNVPPVEESKRPEREAIHAAPPQQAASSFFVKNIPDHELF
jgi:hypothetical protein